MRTLVRRDLGDEDAATYRWTDFELERHIQHAVRELSLLQARSSNGYAQRRRGEP